MVNLGPDANPLAQLVVVVAGHMGHQQLAVFKAQGVQKLAAAERFADDLGFDWRIVVMHDVISAQQHVTLTTGEAQWPGRFCDLGKFAQRSLYGDMRAILMQCGRRKDAVANKVCDKPRGGAVIE